MRFRFFWHGGDVLSSEKKQSLAKELSFWISHSIIAVKYFFAVYFILFVGILVVCDTRDSLRSQRSQNYPSRIVSKQCDVCLLSHLIASRLPSIRWIRIKTVIFHFNLWQLNLYLNLKATFVLLLFCCDF